jgi:hypothetical protein
MNEMIERDSPKPNELIRVALVSAAGASLVIWAAIGLLARLLLS